MKIVIVTPATPHPFGDTAAKWLYVLVRTLLEDGHQVSCITVSEEKDAILRDAEARLSPFAARHNLRFLAIPMKTSTSTLGRKFRSLRQPFSELLYSDGFLDALNRELREGYDVLHLEQLWAGWAGLDRPRSLLNVHHFEVIDWEERRLEGFPKRKARWQMTRDPSGLEERAGEVRGFIQPLHDERPCHYP